MKKWLCLAVSGVMAGNFALTGVPVSAEETAEVFVTIADAEGKLALAQEKISVTDINADGKLTINEALYSAHELYYEGGAEAGYTASETDYGLSLMKLWGTENGGSFGYYVNHGYVMNLGEEIHSGDIVDAFVYTDLNTWSDTYCYFDQDQVNVQSEENFTLALNYIGYDENYSPVSLAVENAKILIDGEETDYFTDTEGKVTLSVDSGEHVISAKSENMLLVPPVCKVTAGNTLKAGDADGNGDINILDVILVNRAILGKSSLTAEQVKAVDFNKNGYPEPDEALMIMKYIVGIITDFS